MDFINYQLIKRQTILLGTVGFDWLVVLRKHQRNYVSVMNNQYEQYFSLFKKSFTRKGLASLDFRNWLEILARYVSPARAFSLDDLLANFKKIRPRRTLR